MYEITFLYMGLGGALVGAVGFLCLFICACREEALKKQSDLDFEELVEEIERLLALR